MVTAFVKKIRHYFLNHSRLISQVEEKTSFGKSNKSSLPYLHFDKFYANANLLFLIEPDIEKNKKEDLEFKEQIEENQIKVVINFLRLSADRQESGFSREDLIVMKNKAKSNLKFLLEIEFKVNY